jgi:hypothetical protein
VAVSDYILGLIVVVSCTLTGMVFLFHYWRYDGIRETCDLELDLGAEEPVEAARSALMDARARHVTVGLGGVSGCTRVSLRSTGTRCRIDIRSSSRGFQFVCECRPRATLVLTDWGASRAKLHAIVQSLEAKGRKPERRSHNGGLMLIYGTRESSFSEIDSSESL